MQDIPRLIVSTQDFDRIQATLLSANVQYTDRLAQEISCAELRHPEDMPPQVVTMNSELIYEDIDTGAEHTIRLVYPRDANIERGWISVLAPLGNAVLGVEEGQQTHLISPKGLRHIRIVKILYQPEAAGEWTL